MMSDVCKHCANASCLEVCPTNAIVRTEFDTVFIQQDVCNGCRDCISACPYGVIGFNSNTGTAQKCTFCYDRLQNNLKPACATACPTQSIKFGPLDEMRQVAATRVATLQAQGMTEARIYGDKEYGGLHAFFLLTDKPETYSLPSTESAVLPSRNNIPGYLGAAVTAVVAAVAGLIAFRRRGETQP
jgi:formate dehydrogenase iron-sulfur subunit